MKRKLTWQTFNYFGVLAVVASIAAVVIVCLVMSGCANLDYGDLHWSRTGNWKSGLVVFNEDICDPNGCSNVTIIIVGPDINHDEMVGKAFEGLVKGLLSK